jgi:4-amino-4-deoxy-L-arabinose transferase-like glycosyltransferase
MASKKRKPNAIESFIKDFGQFNMLVLSFLAGFGGQYFMYMQKQVAPGLALFAVAVMLFILSDLAAGREERLDEIPVKAEVIVFLVIMGIAVFYRLWMIDELPPGCYRDEGQNGNEGIAIMNGTVSEGADSALPVYIEGLTQQAAMYNYFIAVIFKFLGVGPVQIRLASVIFGILCVPAFYFLVRYLFNARLAIIGAFLLAVTRWHINFSRIGFVGIVSVFFVIVCIYFAYRAYKNKGSLDFILLGAATSLSLYSYIAARFIPIGFVIFMAYIFFTEASFFRQNVKGIALALAAFFLVSIPLAAYVVKHPQNFTNRASKVSIFNKSTLESIGGRYAEADGKAKSAFKLFRENLSNTLLMFNRYGDGNPRHNFNRLPQLDFLSGIFFVLGFGYALFNFRKPLHFMLLAMTASLLMPALLTIESPQSLRTVTLTPIIVMFSLLFLGRLYTAALEQFGRKNWAFTAGGFALMLGIIAYNNYSLYFDGYKNNPGSWADFSNEEYAMAKYLHDKGDEWTGIVRPDWIDSYTFHFATYPYQNYERFDLSAWVPIRAKIAKNYTYILGPEMLPLVPLLKELYPNGKYGEFRHKFYQNLLFYFTYEVPYSDVKNQQDGPGLKNGLYAKYFYGTDWKGRIQLERMDPIILFIWTRDPVAHPFSVEWKGRIYIKEAGEYVFRTESNDYSDVMIDGKTVLKNPGFAKSRDNFDGTVRLAAGYHPVTVRYSESIQHSRMIFSWKTPKSADFEVVPNSVLFR